MRISEPSGRSLGGRRIVLGVTGSIAAYKAIELARALTQRGAAVTTLLTPSARQFVAPLSFRALTGEQVLWDQFDPGADDPLAHITLGKTADAVVVAPATANLVGKLAHGLADDLLTSTLLAADCPVIVAPAMHEEMLLKPVVQESLASLQRHGIHVIGPERGTLSGGDEGWGRMAPLAAIVEAAEHALSTDADLAGLRVLVTAGPTYEPLDPVRYLANRSSGKMGYALADEARRRGAAVTLISGPTALGPPAGVAFEAVTTGAEMLEAVDQAFAAADVLLMAAAVADFRARDSLPQKLKRNGSLQIALVPTVDILATVSARKARQLVIGFAAETEDLEKAAREELERKGLDLVVANDVSREDIGFGSDFNEVLLVFADGRTKLIPRAGKTAIARRILDQVRLLRSGTQ